MGYDHSSLLHSASEYRSYQRYCTFEVLAYMGPPNMMFTRNAQLTMVGLGMLLLPLLATASACNYSDKSTTEPRHLKRMGAMRDVRSRLRHPTLQRMGAMRDVKSGLRQRRRLPNLQRMGAMRDVRSGLRKRVRFAPGTKTTSDHNLV